MNYDEWYRTNEGEFPRWLYEHWYTVTATMKGGDILTCQFRPLNLHPCQIQVPSSSSRSVGRASGCLRRLATLPDVSGCTETLFYHSLLWSGLKALNIEGGYCGTEANEQTIRVEFLGDTWLHAYGVSRALSRWASWGRRLNIWSIDAPSSGIPQNRASISTPCQTWKSCF